MARNPASSSRKSHWKDRKSCPAERTREKKGENPPLDDQKTQWKAQKAAPRRDQRKVEQECAGERRPDCAVGEHQHPTERSEHAHREQGRIAGSEPEDAGYRPV